MILHRHVTLNKNFRCDIADIDLISYVWYTIMYEIKLFKTIQERFCGSNFKYAYINAKRRSWNTHLQGRLMC